MPQKTAQVLFALVLTATAFSFSESDAQAASPAKADLYVATEGNDAWSGKLPAPNAAKTDGPFASLARARDAVRELKRSRPTGDIRVAVRGGHYTLNDTVVFGLEDSGASSQTITYSAYGNEKPVFTSGIPIKNWTKLEANPSTKANPNLAALPEAARGKVWVANLPQPLATCRLLYDGEKLLPRARSKPFTPTRGGSEIKDIHEFHFPAGALKKWPNLEDVEILGILGYPWTMNILGLASVDTSAGLAMTATVPTYPFTKSHLTDTAWVENVPEALDEPGEWIVNSKERKIYLWPIGDKPGDSIVAPRLKELIRIEGKINYDAPADEPVRGIVLRGLTFLHGDRDTRTDELLGHGLQHDWDYFDRPNALVRLRGAENCAIENCRFTATGGDAIRLDLYCRANRIANNKIEDVGHTGILLAGYGPGTKNVNRENQVVNNEIARCGVHYWHASAIFVWQSEGNRIAHNLIRHTPYTGIVVSGRIGLDRSGRSEAAKSVRWSEIGNALGEGDRRQGDWNLIERFLHGRKNIVEYNEIHDTMQVMHDGNGIYVSGTGGHNVIRANYVHDIFGKGADSVIRMDDAQYDTLVEGNLIWRAGCQGIVVKQRNDVINNVIADVAREGLALQLGPTQGSKIQRNIFYSTDGKSAPVWEGKTYGLPAYLRECDADYNLYFSPANPDWGRPRLEQSHKENIEPHSAVADPQFADPAKGDFRLSPSSPALKMGFKQLEREKMGLEKGK